MSRTWSNSCSSKRFLIEEFKKFQTSGGAEGIDPSFSSLANKEIIVEVFDKHSILQEYKRNRFPYNFRDAAAAFKVDLTKQGQRKQATIRKQGKFFLKKSGGCVYSIIFFIL